MFQVLIWELWYYDAVEADIASFNGSLLKHLSHFYIILIAAWSLEQSLLLLQCALSIKVDGVYVQSASGVTVLTSHYEEDVRRDFFVAVHSDQLTLEEVLPLNRIPATSLLIEYSGLSLIDLFVIFISMIVLIRLF